VLSQVQSLHLDGHDDEVSSWGWIMLPFNKPFLTGREIEYISQALGSGHLSGNGPFSKKCAWWLEEQIGAEKALLTHSCTAALEMAAILSGVGPGDEVIMPSFTFVSTANAFVLRGATPVFVDVRPDTLNIDETKIEEAITPRTKVIVPVHYAGVGCDMDPIMGIADRYRLLVIEDAAQGIFASYDGRPLGGIGHMAALSFHETKNVISGEGGALLINDSRFIERAEIIWEKGTNRSGFFRGRVEKYTWVDIGSSYLPGEIVAAFLWAQMESADEITKGRMEVWNTYHESLFRLEQSGGLRRPIVPQKCIHNAHMYYLLLPDLERRNAFIARLRANDVAAVFHYVPLHSSPFGSVVGRASHDMSVTKRVADQLVRLPVWMGLEQHEVVAEVIAAAEQV
jgi:dTDP-4-amino-4,6-dideoxygalactose transaminase